MNQKSILVFAGVGFELVGILIAAVYLGQYLDETYELSGLGSAVTIISGLIMWLIHLSFLLVKVSNGADDS